MTIFTFRLWRKVVMEEGDREGSEVNFKVVVGEGRSFFVFWEERKVC